MTSKLLRKDPLHKYHYVLGMEKQSRGGSGGPGDTDFVRQLEWINKIRGHWLRRIRWDSYSSGLLRVIQKDLMAGTEGGFLARRSWSFVSCQGSHHSCSIRPLTADHLNLYCCLAIR